MSHALVKSTVCTISFDWLLRFIFSSSYGKLFLVLFQPITYSFNFYKIHKGF